MRKSHCVATEKRYGQSAITDIETHSSRYPNLWAIIVYKGYQDEIEIYRGIYRKSNPPQGVLTVDEELENNIISSDRIIFEKFVRLYILWKIVSSKYRWSTELYHPVFRFFLAMTIFHIILHPLRSEDLPFSRRYKNKLYTLGQ